MLLMAPLDETIRRWPTVRPFLYVDDLALQTCGSWRRTGDHISKCAKFLVTELESKQHLPVSRGS